VTVVTVVLGLATVATVVPVVLGRVTVVTAVVVTVPMSFWKDGPAWIPFNGIIDPSIHQL
jgi:hypothetical protein